MWKTFSKNYKIWLNYPSKENLMKVYGEDIENKTLIQKLFYKVIYLIMGYGMGLKINKK
jgi:hypothetical protein